MTAVVSVLVRSGPDSWAETDLPTLRGDADLAYDAARDRHGPLPVAAAIEARGSDAGSGSDARPVRLIVIAPAPYRKSQSKKLYYRDPAYLLTSDRRSSLKQLLQIYFDRWQIEVNHRDEKDTLGVGQAQMHNANSVPRQPVLVVAAYSALLLASINAFGPARGNQFLPLPKWRKNAYRPSCLDLITLLRKELVENKDSSTPSDLMATYKQMINGAAA